MTMQKTVLITGASSGIGEATARLLAKNGYRLILTGRRKERLEKLSSHLKEQFNSDVCLLVFDIRHRKSVEAAIDSLPSEFREIDILINNAGLAAGMGKIHEGDHEDWEMMIDTNLKGLLYITRKIAPSMVERKSGHIVNLSSIAGKEVYPDGNVYCASKHAVQALSKAMRIDLLPFNIKVSSIAPGAVQTEFSLVRFKGDKEKAARIYQGIVPLTGDDIADTILYIITRPPHMNIDDMIIMPADQAFSRDFNRK